MVMRKVENLVGMVEMMDWKMDVQMAHLMGIRLVRKKALLMEW